MSTILTLAEYKIAKGITTTDYDAQLSALIGMAQSWIEIYCNRQFGIDDYEEQYEGTIDVQGRYVFTVKNRPINSVASVTLRYFGTTEDLSVDTTRLDIFSKAGYCYYAYVLDPSISVIREEYRTNFYYTISYNGGTAVPEAVKFAAITIVSDTFEYFNRINTINESGTVHVGEISRVKIGSYEEFYNTGDSLFKQTHSEKVGMVLTPTVKALLMPYIHHGQNLR